MSVGLINRVDLAREAADPLAYFRCKSEGQERVAGYVSQRVEVYAHAAERAGKSKIGAAITAAFCLGKDHLRTRDGAIISLPILRPPVRWLIGFDSYKLGGASVMHTLRGVLGLAEEHYHEDLAGGAAGCPSVIRVRHALARSQADWSLIYIFPYDGVRPRSMELDGWWLDEPPPIMYLEAVRSRIGARRDLRGLITATPLERKVWEPIKNQYPGEECAVEGGRVRVRWSVFDNEALPQKVKDELALRAKGSAYEKAKLFGHHVDASGDCPWSAELLDRWLARTYRGELETVRVTDEENRERGRQKLTIARVIETWADVGDPHEPNLVVVDAASGVKSEAHDPSGIHVWGMKSRVLKARFGQIKDLADQWNGYVGPYGLGMLAADLSKRYAVGGHLAQVAVESNGWALPALTALNDAGAWNLLRDRPVDMPGREQVRLGFTTSDRTRPLFLDALEQAMLRDDVLIYSPEVVRCLMDCIIDRNGKIVAGTGYHDEDMILAGSALHHIAQRYRQGAVPEVRESLKDRLLREIHGGQVPRSAVVEVPQERWR